MHCFNSISFDKYIFININAIPAYRIDIVYLIKQQTYRLNLINPCIVLFEDNNPQMYHFCICLSSVCIISIYS